MLTKSFAVGALAALSLVAGSGVANAQLGSVTGSLPGQTTGPLGSIAHTVCNVGSLANLVGVGLILEAPCYVLPSAGEAADTLIGGNPQGSTAALLGGLPGVGSLLEGAGS